MYSVKPQVGAQLNRGNPITQGVVGAWVLNEGSGDQVYDLSGNSYDGTLTNMDPATDWVAEDDGWALDFDRANDYILLPATLSPAGWTGITVVCRVSCTFAGSAEHALFGNWSGDPPKRQILLRLEPTGNVVEGFVELSSGSIGGGFAGVAAGLSANTWYSIALSYGDGALRCYVNGLASSTTYAGTDPLLATPSLAGCTIGRYSGTIAADYLGGQVSDVQIWNRALSADEVVSLYANPWQIIQPRRLWVPSAAVYSSFYYRYMNRMFAEG